MPPARIRSLARLAPALFIFMSAAVYADEAVDGPAIVVRSRRLPPQVGELSLSGYEARRI